MVLHNFFFFSGAINIDFKKVTGFMIHPVYFVNNIFFYKKKCFMTKPVHRASHGISNFNVICPYVDKLSKVKYFIFSNGNKQLRKNFRGFPVQRY